MIKYQEFSDIWVPIIYDGYNSWAERSSSYEDAEKE
jgi:hypothetical protein